eukprot:CAMPEP_0174361968 /NCGR_PEP_ID=MMETSP0811_2-20130205/61953_1 /TAXON_ID=73025 ORGANISM="Eutreptiella gymnastica-like, Strain CCMP1594" /NCGR_SAMPLE_ID=MMETSP0811_2 /ASSEMBLY_ACC=CAM_ASM_000667 /LENGTH=62 /DNA_ID=CAMNT_0015499141 /DNA_START=380 /DNA_END=568 /DNA_ORIENTATION=+
MKHAFSRNRTPPPNTLQRAVSSLTCSPTAMRQAEGISTWRFSWLNSTATGMVTGVVGHDEPV